MHITLRFYKRFVVRYWPYYLFGMLALFATNYLTVLVPSLVQRSLDALQVDSTGAAAAGYAMQILPIALAIMVVRTLSRLLFFNPGRAVEFNIKNALFRHLLSLPQAYFDRNAVGDLTSRATNDINYVRALVGFAGLQIFNVLFATPMTLWKMWQMSPDLTLRALMPLCLAIVIMWASIQMLANRMRMGLEQLSALSDHILETYNAVPTIQGWNARPVFHQQYLALNSRYTHTQVVVAAVRSCMIPLIFLLASASVVGVVWFGGQDVIDGQLTVGVIAAFATYITMLVGQFMSFGWTLNVLQRGYLALNRIYEVLDEPVEQPSTQHASLPAMVSGALGDPGYTLTVKGLTFAYQGLEGRAHALEDVSFEVRAGETLGIFGPTGAGKTTLVQVLARVYDPPAGSVFVNNVDILNIDLSQLRQITALVPQDPFLFSRSLSENIAWGHQEDGSADEEGVLKAATKACLADDLVQLPQGLNTLVGARGITLSGGQRQRTAIARAFQRPFHVLLLDDVLSAVDHNTEQKLISHIYEAAQGQTTVLVAHRLSVLRHADTILVLDRGRVIDCGTHEALLERCPLYGETWRNQQDKVPQGSARPGLSTQVRAMDGTASGSVSDG